MAKSAAAYGLRKMRGRMKKQAMTLLVEGLKHENVDTRQVCAKALQLIKQAKESAQHQGAYGQQPGQQQRAGPGQQRRFKPKFRISEIPPKRPQGYMPRYGRKNPPQPPRFNR